MVVRRRQLGDYRGVKSLFARIANRLCFVRFNSMSPEPEVGCPAGDLWLGRTYIFLKGGHSCSGQASVQGLENERWSCRRKWQGAQYLTPVLAALGVMITNTLVQPT